MLVVWKDKGDDVDWTKRQYWKSGSADYAPKFAFGTESLGVLLRLLIGHTLLSQPQPYPHTAS